MAQRERMANCLGEKLPAFSPAAWSTYGWVTPSWSGLAGRVRHSTQPCCKNTGKAIFSENINTDISLKGQVKGHRLFPMRRGWIEGEGLLFASLRGFINFIEEQAPVIEALRGKAHSREKGTQVSGATLQPERWGRIYG